MKKNKALKNVTSVTLTGNKEPLLLDYRTLRKAVLNVRAVDHDVRKKIISMLLEKGSMTVTDVYSELNMEQSVASQHLAVLRRAGLVQTDRNRKFIAYSVNPERMSDINVFVKNLAS
jgi:DNA-binding transcriptional ArsR family regulator